jgi:hypothetical protein
MPGTAWNRGRADTSPASSSSGADTLRRYLRWYIGIRLVVVSTVLLLTTLLELYSPPPGTAFDLGGVLHSSLVFYVAGPTYFATLIYIALLRLFPRHPSWHAHLQFFGDLALITALVHFLGGAASPFSLLYLIVIAIASSLLSRQAGLVVACLSFLLHCSVAFGLIPPVDPGEAISGVRLGINLGVHFFGFFAMALLTSYLSRNVQRAEQELEEKAVDLRDLQVVHRDVIQSITAVSSRPTSKARSPAPTRRRSRSSAGWRRTCSANPSSSRV